MTGKIKLSDFEMRQVMEQTGLKRLEVLGVVGALNEIQVPKAASQRQYDEDERMGRTI